MEVNYLRSMVDTVMMTASWKLITLSSIVD